MKRIDPNILPLKFDKLTADGVLVRCAFADGSSASAILMRERHVPRGRSYWQANELDFTRVGSRGRRFLVTHESGWFRCTLRQCAWCRLPWFGTDEPADESVCTACGFNEPPDAWVGAPESPSTTRRRAGARSRAQGPRSDARHAELLARVQRAARAAR